MLFAAERLVWLLATTPSPALRDAVEAIRIAEAAARHTGDRDAAILDALAAAYAAAGRFPDAIRTARRAEQLAANQGDVARARAIGKRLARYRAGHPSMPPSDTEGGIAPSE
jgi:Flp pilus assembly protein TadD